MIESQFCNVLHQPPHSRLPRSVPHTSRCRIAPSLPACDLQQGLPQDSLTAPCTCRHPVDPRRSPSAFTKLSATMGRETANYPQKPKGRVSVLRVFDVLSAEGQPRRAEGRTSSRPRAAARANSVEPGPLGVSATEALCGGAESRAPKPAP